MSRMTHRAMLQQLRTWHQAGVERIIVESTRNDQSSDDKSRDADVGAAQVPPSIDQHRETALNLLRCEVAQCTCCDELVRNRTQTVFGVGNDHPRLCFLGEAPGADEDRVGEPFVGRSGQLLNKILQACTLRREEVYILNVIKCRPPNNRNPGSGEIDNCRHFYVRQLEILRPEFICCLGGVAATELLQTKSPIGRLRGRFHPWRESQVVVTYHPSYLLRNPAAKKDTWEDMQMLMQAMNIPLEIPRRN